MSATLMDSPSTIEFSPEPPRTRPRRCVPSARASSRLAGCLRRCAAAGLRLVVTAPGDGRAFSRGLRLFPERRIDPALHARWETAFRVLRGSGPESHDRGSWRILVVGRDDRVLGAITARFFCRKVLPDYLQLRWLLEMTGPVFREHCETAMADALATAARDDRTPAEVSQWMVAPTWHAPLIAVTLMRAMSALAAAFDAPSILVAADNRRGEVSRLMRLGGRPLGIDGRACLPPFVHHPTGAWLRLLVIEAPTFHARSRSRPAADLALLRHHATFISAS